MSEHISSFADVKRRLLVIALVTMMLSVPIAAFSISLASGAVSSFPYNQGFESGQNNNAINEANWGSNQWTYRGTNHSGSHSAGAAIDTKGDDTRRLFVNVNFSGKACTSISYWYKITFVDNHSRMMRLIGSINSTNGQDGSWFFLGDWTDITCATSWTQFYADQNLYRFSNQPNCYIKIQAEVIGFPSGTRPNQRTLYVDDFHIEVCSFYGPEHVFESDDRPYYDYQISIARLDSSHVLLAYRTDGDHGNLVAATISSGNIIASGDEHPFSTNATYISATALDDTRVLIAYNEGGQGGVAFVATVDKANNDVSFGSGRTQYSANSERTSAVRLDSTHIFIVYYAAAQIITVNSNNTITKGTAYNFPDTNPSDVHHDISVTALSSSKVMIAYNVRINPGTTDPHFEGTAVVATVSNGTQITYGARNDFNNNVDTDLVAVTALGSSSALIVYQNNGASGTACVATVDTSNTITYWPRSEFHTAGTNGIRAAALGATNRVLVVFWDGTQGKNGQGTGIVLTVYGNTLISHGPEGVFNYPDESYYLQATTLDDRHVIISYKDTGNDYCGTAIVATV